MAAGVALGALAAHAKRDPTFVPTKDKHTERWHARAEGRDFELLTAGPKFFDTRAKSGGGGAIDLAMHLYRMDFKAATDLLRRQGL